MLGARHRPMSARCQGTDRALQEPHQLDVGVEARGPVSSNAKIVGSPIKTFALSEHAVGNLVRRQIRQRIFAGAGSVTGARTAAPRTPRTGCPRAARAG